MASVDLGKAHVKVVLSDEIPGVARDLSKLRQSATITIGMDGQRMQNNGAYGVMELSMSGENDEKLATAIMPIPLFEPVDNYYWQKTNSPDEATTDVYWTKIPFGSLSEIFSQRVLEQNPGAENENTYQKWKTTTETVDPLRFSEVEYKQTNIDYEGLGYQTKEEKEQLKKSENSDGETVQSTENVHVVLKQTPGGNIVITYVNDPESVPPAETATDTAEATAQEEVRPVEQTESSQFVRQYESLASVWWGLQSTYFKEPQWPFWVVVRTHSINLRKDKDKSALLSIRIRDSSREQNEYEKRANGDNMSLVKNIELIIDTTGTATLHWQIEESRADKNNVKTTFRFNNPIELPEISSAFREKGELRIGFLPIMGRLCIFSNPSSYQIVQFTSSDQKRLIAYGLNNTAVTVQGYGCTASIQAFPMTFFHKSWVTLADRIPNKDNSVRGYQFPSKAEGDVKAHSLGNGCFICAPTSLKEYRDNKSRLKYSGSFREYKEVLLDADSTTNDSREDKCNITLSDKDVGYYGMMHAWGQLHIVRRGKDDNFDEPFWFAFFGSAELLKRQIIPGETKTKTINAQREYKPAGHVGFPYLVAVRSVKPRQADGEEYNVLGSGSTEVVSDDITQISVTSELDNAHKPTYVQRSGSVTVFNRDGYYTKFLSRARGIRIWMRWDQNDTTSFTDDDLVFSGIAYGRSSVVSPGEQYITFNCVDHWKVLESFHIKNSPYYDGFEITAVMEDIAERAGIDFQDDIDRSQVKQGGPGYYFLGSGYRIFDQAKYRFNHSSPLKDCLTEVIKNFEFYMYFTDAGVLHIAPIPGGFTWDKTNVLWNNGIKATYFLELDGLSDPTRLIVDSFEINSTLSEGMHNVFLVQGIERVWSRPILVADSRPESLTNPDDIGYLGYISEIEVAKPDLNSEEACQGFLAGTLRRLYSRPGFETTFKTIGHLPPYIPGEFIRIEDDPAGALSETLTNKFRVTRVEQQYNARSNEWVTSIGGYQVAPAVSNKV